MCYYLAILFLIKYSRFILIINDGDFLYFYIAKIQVMIFDFNDLINYAKNKKNIFNLHY